MPSAHRTAVQEPSAGTAPRGGIRALARACLWLSVAVLTLAVAGLALVVVLHLAPHVAPAGGGA